MFSQVLKTQAIQTILKRNVDNEIKNSNHSESNCLAENMNKVVNNLTLTITRAANLSLTHRQQR